MRGNPAAATTLLEYGDFECPYCGVAHRTVDEVQVYFGDDLNFVFRHFPLTQVHPHAEKAAESAEAAGAQGRFWEMHELLFENQEALDDTGLLALAAALGLDVPRLNRELVSETHRPRVREDFLSGVRSGVNGTPTFFINGVRHDGTWDTPSLVAAIEATRERGRGRQRMRGM